MTFTYKELNAWPRGNHPTPEVVNYFFVGLDIVPVMLSHLATILLEVECASISEADELFKLQTNSKKIPSNVVVTI